ncbi:MAG: beta-galactosidase, partial [Paenibacillus sp.]|nr:beta-galactosidase [Paenibacillus sp.]
MKKERLRKITAFLTALTLLPASLTITTFADVSWTTEEWNVSEQQFSKIESFRVGREDARSSFFSFTDQKAALDSQQNGKDRELSNALYQSMDSSAGQNWKFYYVPKPDDRKNRPDNAHIMNSDYDDSKWDDITVPKSWEASYNEDKTFKYDPPHYSNVTYPWASQSPNPSKPNAPTQFNPVGFYRTKLNVDSSFQGRKVFLTFEGVESAFYVWVNGHKVGFSEDSYTSKEFKIDEYLKYDGTDTLAVEVFKWSSGSWLEDQDNIRLAGIFRSVYLTSKDDVEIRDFTIVPKKTVNGTDPLKDYQDFDLDIYTSIRDLGASDAKKDNLQVSVDLYTQDGRKLTGQELENVSLSQSISASDFVEKDSMGRKFKTVKLSARVKQPQKWSAEHPNLYKALITLRDKQGTIIETTAYRFGFRIIEIKNKNTENAQMLINGQPLLIKGVNIHEFDPTTGRYVSSQIIRKDITMMKQNNFNAVRMSHYSHDFRYYDVADELGLYVMDETNLETHGDRSIPGSNPNYLPACLDRVSSMFYRSKNFPSVIILSLGNEAGTGDNFGKMAQWLKGTYTGSPNFYVDSLLKGDIQNRPIHYEGDNDKADIKSNMYPSIESIKDNSKDKKPYILCEYNHSMGNSNGNFQGYWDAFESK